MKYLSLMFTFSFCCSISFGQCQQYIDKEILGIKGIPYHYQKGKLSDKIKIEFKDVSYLNIKKLDTSAIRFLINKLTDTTLTSIDNTCMGTKLKIADLAFFLINDIEPVPYAMVTGGQYCTLGECGSLPDGFLYFINAQRLRFKNEYTKFYYGAARKEWLREFHPIKKRRT